MYNSLKSTFTLQQLQQECNRLKNDLKQIVNNFYNQNKRVVFNLTKTIISSISKINASRVEITTSTIIEEDSAMNLSINKTHRFFIETEKIANRKHRRENNLCLYCASSNHHVDDCLKARKVSLRVISIAFISASSFDNASTTTSNDTKNA